MARRCSWLVLIALLAVLSACVPVEPSATPPVRTSPPPPSLPPPAQTTNPPPLTSPTSAAFIDYWRTGGIAGFSDHLSIAAQGHAVLTRRQAKFEFDLTRDEITQLEAALRDADLASISERSDKSRVPDAFTYVLSYQGRTLQVSDPSLPQKLVPVISLLNNLIDTRGR